MTRSLHLSRNQRKTTLMSDEQVQDQIERDVEEIARYFTTPDSARNLGDKSQRVENAILRIAAGFLSDVRRIADAQEKTAALLEADATPQTLVRVEERRGTS
jgi:hypothetical protein